MGEKAAHGFLNRREERPLTEAREDPEPFQLVLDGIFHFCKTHLDPGHAKCVVELTEGVC